MPEFRISDKETHSPLLRLLGLPSFALFPSTGSPRCLDHFSRATGSLITNMTRGLTSPSMTWLPTKETILPHWDQMHLFAKIIG